MFAAKEKADRTTVSFFFIGLFQGCQVLCKFLDLCLVLNQAARHLSFTVLDDFCNLCSVELATDLLQIRSECAFHVFAVATHATRLCCPERIWLEAWVGWCCRSSSAGATAVSAASALAGGMVQRVLMVSCPSQVKDTNQRCQHQACRNRTTRRTAVFTSVQPRCQHQSTERNTWDDNCSEDDPVPCSPRILEQLVQEQEVPVRQRDERSVVRVCQIGQRRWV